MTTFNWEEIAVSRQDRLPYTNTRNFLQGHFGRTNARVWSLYTGHHSSTIELKDGQYLVRVLSPTDIHIFKWSEAQPLASLPTLEDAKRYAEVLIRMES